ncbi:MAG TPA: Gfo/Idh/MocA family oxidoreductase [Atribacteraceae bacterium]|nr:Gfo/Idh/MocA family oxidoreductase [Atribacteraceae bacterium]
MPIPGFEAITPRDISEPRLGVGILGCGFMGKVHANGYRKIPYTYADPPCFPELVAMAGRNAERVRDTARRFGFLGYYTDWEKQVCDPRIQVFDNCAPDDLHAEPSIAAMREGKHVLCEKPLALTAAEAFRMWRQAERSGVKHMCCYNYRFIPAVRLARQLLTEGVLGRVYQFRARYLQESGHLSDEVMEQVWYASGTASGVLLGIGSHIVDMARYLVGEIRSVSGLVKTFHATRCNRQGSRQPVETDEGNLALLEFENGAVGSLESSGVSTGRKNQLTWEINGSLGSMVFDLEDLNHLQVYLHEQVHPETRGFSNVSVTNPGHPLQSLILPPGHNSGWEYGHVHALAHFLNCVVNDTPVKPHAADFYDGYLVQVIMEAIKASAAEGKKILISEHRKSVEGTR